MFHRKYIVHHYCDNLCPMNLVQSMHHHVVVLLLILIVREVLIQLVLVPMVETAGNLVVDIRCGIVLVEVIKLKHVRNHVVDVRPIIQAVPLVDVAMD